MAALDIHLDFFVKKKYLNDLSHCHRVCMCLAGEGSLPEQLNLYPNKHKGFQIFICSSEC